MKITLQSKNKSKVDSSKNSSYLIQTRRACNFTLQSLRWDRTVQINFGFRL